MLIVLPPSETKAVPVRGRPLDLDTLALPSLAAPRRELLDALVTLSANDPAKAADVLHLGPTQADAIERNAVLASIPTARADAIYTGVLYSALDLPSLDAAAKRRATRWLATASALFGLVRPSDRIPPYRLSGDTTLPGIGPVGSYWRPYLEPVVSDLVGDGLLVDLRSQTYAGLFRPDRSRTATLRVLHERDGKRSVVSHFNKATKGRIVRALLTEGVTVRAAGALADALRDLGWTVEQDDGRLDVIVEEL